MPLEHLISTVSFGVAFAFAVWAGFEYYDPALNWVESDLRDKFRRLRRPTHNLRAYLLAWLAVAAGMFVTLWVSFGMPVIGLSIAVLWVCLPWFLLRRMAEERKRLVEDQLADSMVSLSSSIKAGLSLAQALDILARQMPSPICEEFAQITGEYQMGKPLDRCLQETKERLRSENFALFAAAMEASRQSGGRLNETVDRIANSVRELQRLERKIESETAQARASAFYMALAPFAVLAVYYYVVDPANTARLFTSFWGQIMLSVALFLNVVAYLWARRILNPTI